MGISQTRRWLRLCHRLAKSFHNEKVYQQRHIGLQNRKRLILYNTRKIKTRNAKAARVSTIYITEEGDITMDIKDVLNWKKSGLFAAGVLFGTAGIKVLSSKDAKEFLYKLSLHAAVLRVKWDCVMKTATCVQENATDIYESAKQMNEGALQQQKRHLRM